MHWRIRPRMRLILLLRHMFTFILFRDGKRNPGSLVNDKSQISFPLSRRWRSEQFTCSLVCFFVTPPSQKKKCHMTCQVGSGERTRAAAAVATTGRARRGAERYTSQVSISTFLLRYVSPVGTERATSCQQSCTRKWCFSPWSWLWSAHQPQRTQVSLRPLNAELAASG